jgi:hypothetical protein
LTLPMSLFLESSHEIQVMLFPWTSGGKRK